MPRPDPLAVLTKLLHLLFDSELELVRLAEDLRTEPSVHAIASALARRADWPALLLRRRAPHPEAIVAAAQELGVHVDLEAFNRAQLLGLRELWRAGQQLESLVPAGAWVAGFVPDRLAVLDRLIGEILSLQEEQRSAPNAFGYRIRTLLLERFVAHGLGPEAWPDHVRRVQNLLADQRDFEAVVTPGLFLPGSPWRHLRMAILRENARASWAGARVWRTIELRRPAAAGGAELAELLPLWWLGVLACPGQVHQRVATTSSTTYSYARWATEGGWENQLATSSRTTNVVLVGQKRMAAPAATVEPSAERTFAQGQSSPGTGGTSIEDVVGAIWQRAA